MAKTKVKVGPSQTVTNKRTVLPPAPKTTTTPKTTTPSSVYGRYTLDMDPGVIAAKAYEKQGLADLQNSPYPSMPDTSSYDMQLAQAQEDKTIGTGRLDYSLGLNKGNLEHSNMLAGRNIINNLAERGMLRSGETPGLKAEQLRSFTQAMTDLGVKDTWARQDLDRGVARASAAITAARAAANSAYSSAMADRQRGIAIDTRNLHKTVTDAYVEAARYVFEHPELFMGNSDTFNPADWLSQIPQ